MSEQQSLAPIKDPYFDLIREVIGNPDAPAEKLKILVDMRLLLEDREAEKAFKSAMLAAQKEVKALKWDKVNPEKNSRYASYPKIEEMLCPIREKHGFVQSFDSEPSDAPDQMIFCCDVTHEAGFTKRYRLPMSTSGLGAKGGGVMSGAQAVGNGVSYGMRNIQKMIWNIPMLVDRDDNDGNAPPPKPITEKQVADLTALAAEAAKDDESAADVLQAYCKYIHIEKIQSLPATMFKEASNTFKNRKAKNDKARRA